MSQRPPAPRPASRSPPDGQKITLPPVQRRDDAQRAGRGDESEQGEARGFPPQPPPMLSPQYGRPLQPAPPGEDWRVGRSRDLGVHSILNPAEPEDTMSSSRRVSGEAESPLSVGPSSHFGASPSLTTQHTFPGQHQVVGTPPMQPGYPATFPRGRPILTPRSPRVSSFGRGQGQTTIDTARSPFLTGRSRAYTAEPGQSASSEVPPMPTPPGQTQGQQHYGFPPPVTTPRRASTTMPAPGRTPHSQSASPNISQSSHELSSQTSPASYPYQVGPTPSSQGYFPGSTFAQAGGGMQYAAGPGQTGSSSATEGPYSAPPPSSSQQQAGDSSGPASASTSRQGSSSDPIQVLTITTSQGIYNVPVDVHQASRSADEKRARNAGASARFRQRRKEKERDSQAMIDKMQSQTRDLERKVRELEQERDFYRGERDRFREVVFRTPEMRHLAMQAPPSPQSMRSGSFGAPGMTMGGPPPSSQQAGPPPGFQQEAQPGRPSRRRRTGSAGEFASVSYTRPPPSTLPPVVAPGYPSGPSNLPPLRIESTAASQAQQTAGLPNIAPAATAGPASGPFDPYARGRYERGWPSERGRR